MNRSVIFGGCVVVAAVVLCLTLRREEAMELRVLDGRSQAATDELAKLQTVNEQLAASVAAAGPGHETSRGGSLDLAHLRASVSKLRQAVKEKARLQAANERLRGVAEQKEARLAETERAPNYWPKERLAFCGWATPESAVQSLLWTMKKGDAKSWQAECTPEAQAALEKELAGSGKSAEERESAAQNLGRQMVEQAAGFHIAGQEIVGNDEALVDLSFDGEGVVRRFTLKRLGNDWKFDNVVLAMPAPKEAAAQ